MVLRARDRILAANRDLILRNLDAIEHVLGRVPDTLRWSRPRAGSVGLAELVGESSASRLCDELLAETGLLLLPSTAFDHGDRHVRLGFGRADFAEGLDELVTWLAARV